VLKDSEEQRRRAFNLLATGSNTPIPR